MSSTDLSMTETRSVARAAETYGGFARRLYFMDNLRVALTVLIVLQHSSFALRRGSWWWLQRSGAGAAARLLLHRQLQLPDEPLFFLIAGYFSALRVRPQGAEQLS
jgi:hypothetical protein